MTHQPNTRGYVIMAVNNSQVDYVYLATILRDSIYRAMPDSKVSLITDQTVTDPLWDRVIPIVDGDNTDWKLANDWQVYHLSPYEYTIKLEADMYIPRSIEYWWDVLKDRDINIATTIRNFRGDISGELFYRRTFVESNLPQTYNALTYFRKSPLAQEFFHYVEDIFHNWSNYLPLLKYSTEDRATTDVVYALAATAVGVDRCTLPHFTEFSMVHMKRMINNLSTEIWHDELVYEVHPTVFRINTYPQLYPVHYHNKDFAYKITEELHNG
jgi:hypothetical protein